MYKPACVRIHKAYYYIITIIISVGYNSKRVTRFFKLGFHSYPPPPPLFNHSA
jgi:hypothetical protein